MFLVVAESVNSSAKVDIEQALKNELPKSTVFWFFASIALAIVWVLYMCFYNSRVVALIVTFVSNRFVPHGHVKFGSFSISVLSGKVVLRDFHYVTEDFSLRIHYGWIIFKYWRKYIPKEATEDLSHLETRVNIFVDGFEFHVYNRSGNYSQIEKLFNSQSKQNSQNVGQESSTDLLDSSTDLKRSAHGENFRKWRDLIPVIKISVSYGRCVFGNQFVPNTLVFYFEDGNFVYTTKPASNPTDLFMHYGIGNAENFKLMLVPSPKYAGPVDEPPRYMGEGYVVLQTRDINVHYYQDEAGLVPLEPEIVELADGEIVVRNTNPCFGMDIKCGRNTDFNYGPWADRQREHIWKFFYPADYQPMMPTQPAKHGEIRQFKNFEFRMSTLEKANLDVLFTKDFETQAIHFTTHPGSYIETNIPWVIEDIGYTSKVKGQFLYLDCTTSLQYRNFVECETLEYEVTAFYPLVWNDHQDWKINFIACKATLWLIFYFKSFFKDLIEDWSTKSVPDIYHFVPYTWNVNLLIKDFELILLANEYNWIDTNSQNSENTYLACTGEVLELSMILPFFDYLPSTVQTEIVVKGENAIFKLFLPETNTSRHVIKAISENMILMDKNGQVMKNPFDCSEKKQWTSFTKDEYWIDCAQLNNAVISIGYKYHPMPCQQKKFIHNFVREDLKHTETEENIWPEFFNPGDMDHDLIAVEVEVAASLVCLYGSLLRNIVHIKENYLGEDQRFTELSEGPDFAKSMEETFSNSLEEKTGQLFDAREYRPFAVTVSVNLHDIQGHLVKNCSTDELPCPNVNLERLCFEMDKKFQETKLQLLLSPAILVAKDNLERDYDDKHLNIGHLGLSGLQVRGHAMFSHKGLPLNSETLEYAWLIEATVGDLTGKLTCSQLQNLVEFLMTFITLVEDPENNLIKAKPFCLCQHMLPQPQCKMLPNKYKFYCPSSEDIKYKMTRVSLDSINFFLVESGTALNVQLYPLRASFCNLHGKNTRAGITCRMENISFTQYISDTLLATKDSAHIWLESGGLSFGPIDAEAAMALPTPEYHEIQHQFLKLHDNDTKRLWFLWPSDIVQSFTVAIGKCGCLGGCSFFGSNRNGIGFFNPKKFKERPNAAVLQVSPKGEDPSFGQSLLFSDKLMFEVTPTNAPLSPVGKGFNFTRGYMSETGTPDTPSFCFSGKENMSGQKSSASTENSTGLISAVNLFPSFDSTLTSNAFNKSSVSNTDEGNYKVSSPSDFFQFSKESESVSCPISEAFIPLARKGEKTDNARPAGSPRCSPKNMQSPASLRKRDNVKSYSAVSLESEYYSAEEGEQRPTSGLSVASNDTFELAPSPSFHIADASQDTIKPGDSSVMTSFFETTAIDASSDIESTITYESASGSDSSSVLDSRDLPDNLSLVDLHGQVNKPISESPVLFSSYSRHLSQLRCNDWCVPLAVQNTRLSGIRNDHSAFSLLSAGQSKQYTHSPACIPHFIKIKQGFHTSQMKTLEQENYSQDATMFSKNSEEQKEKTDASRGIVADLRENNASITTAVVKIKNSIDIMLSPLFLESFERYVKAVIPTVSNLHPSAIIDGLHSQCLDQLKRQNRLKKGVTVADLGNSDKADYGSFADRQFSTESRFHDGEMKSSSIQALFSVPKINICFLQTGIVEELISFSALENLNELTCASLLAVSLGDIRCQLLSSAHSCKTLQDPNSLSTSHLPKSSPKKQKSQTKDTSQNNEPDNQISEICREEDVGTLHISCIHLQLRRLLKDSNYSNDVLLTVIPQYNSKVHFTFDKDFLSGGIPLASPSHRNLAVSPKGKTQQIRRGHENGQPSIVRQSSKTSSDEKGTSLPRFSRQHSFSIDDSDPSSPSKLRRQSSSDTSTAIKNFGIGFIMFECGLEEINATAVRRLGFKDIYLGTLQEGDNTASAVPDIHIQTKTNIESQMTSDGRDQVGENKYTGIQPSSDKASIHSWDSRVSLPSSASSIEGDNLIKPLVGDSSGGILHLSTIWFNFAAPPPVSIKQKVDYTRLDWNLLSTGTPAINAWMNPFDRLLRGVRHVSLALAHRTSTVMACMMTDALKEESIHLPKKSRFEKLTTLSETFQEDPSCQLLTVLRKYIRIKGRDFIESAVTSETLPQLITIQKGILALTRQWKNVLYMPYMTEIDFKMRKSVNPYTVRFAVPIESQENQLEDEPFQQFETADERTSLLQAEGGLVQFSDSNHSTPLKQSVAQNRASHDTSDVGSNTSFPSSVKHLHSLPSGAKSASQTFQWNTIIESPEKCAANSHLKEYPSSIKRNDSNYSFHSAATSLNSLGKQDFTPPSTPVIADTGQPASLLKNGKVDKFEDLYQWMAKQKEDFRSNIAEEERAYRRQDSFLGGFGWGQDDSRIDLNDKQLMLATQIMQLADAQSIFKPFLQSIGLHVEGVRPSAMMKKFGGSLSLQGKFDYLKIQIAESDKKSLKGKGKSKKKPKWNISIDTPSFLCEDFSANVNMNDVVDFELKETGDLGQAKTSAIPRNFAMHKLEAKPTTLQVNFMMNVQAVTQNVDMPLLRLIHQFVMMAENLIETKKELKHCQSNLEWIKTHRKQDSKGSNSSADTQHSDMSLHSSTGVSPPQTENQSQAPLSREQMTFKPVPARPSKLYFEPKKCDKLAPQVKQFHISKQGHKVDILSHQGQEKEKPSHAITPIQSLNLSDSVTIDVDDVSSPTETEKNLVDEIKNSTPRVWKTLYALLELYSTMPETKTVGKKPSMKLPVIEEEPDVSDTPFVDMVDAPQKPQATGKEEKENMTDAKEGLKKTRHSKHMDHAAFKSTSFRHSVYVGESIPLVVFGIAKIENLKVMAALSGLKLEAELKCVHASGSYREKVKGFLHRKSSESSITGHIGQTAIKLIEGVPPDSKTVVSIKVDCSQGLYTTIMRRGKDHNSALVTIGLIDINIPQHPVMLHGMMTRSTRQITNTLQEFRRQSNRQSRTMENQPEANSSESGKGEITPQAPKLAKEKDKNPIIKPSLFNICFKAILKGIVVGASLLPSLKAQHKTGCITLSGFTGKKARFTLDLPEHSLSFKSKVMTTETSIPSQASVDLPPIHMFANYCQWKPTDVQRTSETFKIPGLTLIKGNYLNAVAEIGLLQHNLSTDLLNHLVFVQKVFMKEVNELVQKVSGSDHVIPAHEDGEHEHKSSSQAFLYSLRLTFKGIQVVATTPTSSAVQLETGIIDLDISNRVHRKPHVKPQLGGTINEIPKLLIRGEVDLNLALGQQLRNPLFEEADAEFQTMAFFKTKIGIRNALQDEMIPGGSAEQEALLITLLRPIILAHPLAFDKAVLVWLNYKNAYEYWTEQRMALNHEVQRATREVISKIPFLSASPSPENLSTLFLQLTVDDMGICVPASPIPSQLTPVQNRVVDNNELGSAVVLTIKSTQISACSCGSLVCKGKFQDFCLRFAEDFDTSWDDWKPDPAEKPVMDACVVPEGTYEVCSRTINKGVQDACSNAKWILNVKWEMMGIDVHLDTNIGKRLSALGNTLTALAGDTDEDIEEENYTDDGHEDLFSYSETNMEKVSGRRNSNYTDSLPDFVYNTSIDPKKRFRLIEREMNEQANIVQDLRQLGARPSLIELESKKLEELKSIVFQDFRREFVNKIKKQSESRTSALRDQLGISSRPSHFRSKSYCETHSKKNSVDYGVPMAFKNDHTTGSRLTSVDWSQTLPVKGVQFGDTDLHTYSLPETPESLSSMDNSPVHVNRLPKMMKPNPVGFPGPFNINQQTSDSSGSLSDFDDSDEFVDYTTKTGFKRASGSGTYRKAEDTHMLRSENSNPSIGSSSRSIPPEPNIDFELDVNVFIDSGKCVLHPDFEEDTSKSRQSKREKTPTFDESSPQPKSKTKPKESQSTFPSGKKTASDSKPKTIENTVFFIPSVNVKVHYNSKTSNVSCDPMAPSTSNQESYDSDSEMYVVTIRKGPYGPYQKLVPHERNEYRESISSSGGPKKTSIKKANLYALLSLQSLPEEMIISPGMLVFLEQALRPLSFNTQSTAAPSNKKMDIMGNMLNFNLDASYNSLTPNFGTASFPVNVVVYVKFEPSTIRLNSLPDSKVECLLQVPSVEVVFSSKGSDIESINIENIPTVKGKGVSKKIVRERNLSGGKGSDNRSRASSTTSMDPTFVTQAGGGLNITFNLSDFSLYIFHPYGGANRKIASQMHPANDARHELDSIMEHSTTLSEIGRRDMLSLNVEFVKVNIARGRKIEVKNADGSAKQEPHCRSNKVRFSAVIDIGSAAFKYDMRRLSEILSFPKSWYNVKLARRLFLGDDSYVHSGDDEDWDSTSDPFEDLSSKITSDRIFISSPALHMHSGGNELCPPTHHRRGSSGDKIKVQLSSELKQVIDSKVHLRGSISAPQSPINVSQEDSTTSCRTTQHQSSMAQETPLRQRHHTLGSSPAKPQSSWETLVLFVISLAKLDLHVNMSNVMGNTIWTTKQVKSDGRLSIDSTGHKDLIIKAGMDSSHFESKGGVVGGTVDLSQFTTNFEVCEDPDIGTEPSHKAGLQLTAIEFRLDYMGTSVMMARLSELDATMRDEWHVETKTDSDLPLATKRPAFLFAHGNLGWNHFHMMISRSTTPDILKMISKIEEFFTQQLSNSKRVLSSLGPISTTKPKSTSRRKSEDVEPEEFWDMIHHRHWQKALELVAGCHFSMLPSVIPKEGAILGGNITLKGNNMSLACFHGINFKAKSWALFTVNDLFILFATEAQKIPNEGTHVVQDLTFNIGSDSPMIEHGSGIQSKATIIKLSRGQTMPPTFTSLQQWFQFAFSTTEIKGLDNFPSIERNIGEENEMYRSRGRKSTVYNHDTETIFALPSLQMHLRSIHKQGKEEPKPEDQKPVVECSFVTEFEDHILVAMDAEVILFLHDLISMYIKEKYKGSRLSYGQTSKVKSSDSDKKKVPVTNPTEVLKQDWREYECNTWQLEPTVRLLHWASKQIDPVGVDYVLNKLGFTHARVTIPKWMQRGFMDPLDKLISFLIQNLIITLKEKEKVKDLD